MRGKLIYALLEEANLIARLGSSANAFLPYVVFVTVCKDASSLMITFIL